MRSFPLYQVCLPVAILFLRFFDVTLSQRITRFQKLATHQHALADDWIQKHHNHWSSFDSSASSAPSSSTTTWAIGKIAANSSISSECPCDDPQDCFLPSSSRMPRKELFGFAGNHDSGEHYNWTYITTIAWVDLDQLMCAAHRHGARAVVANPSLYLTYVAALTGSEYRAFIQNWVKAALQMVQRRFRDGIVFDFEGPLPRGSKEGDAYVDVINATRLAFHAATPTKLQVSTCVAWSPYGIDGRNYPYTELSQVSDLLYVMDYDTQSQITQGPCIANANAPIEGMKQGLQQYLALGIPASKLVLGVPWYGYQYPCLAGMQLQDRFCSIQQVPFRGVGCSDAAGREVAYGQLLEEYDNSTAVSNTTNLRSLQATTHQMMKRDDYMDAAYFNMRSKSDDVVYQSWMDDSISLTNKFSYARSLELGGVGPFTFSDIYASSHTLETQRMWSSLDAFFLETGGTQQQ